jgi:hypothetical protein
MIAKLAFIKLVSALQKVLSGEGRQPDWDKIFANGISDKGFSPKLFKELFSSEKTNSPVIKMAEDLNSYLTSEGSQMVNRHMKRNFVWGQGGNRKSHLLWLECKMPQTLLKTVGRFLQTYGPVFMLFGFLCRVKIHSTQNLHMDDFGSFIHHWQNLETVKTSFSRWTDK